VKGQVGFIGLGLMGTPMAANVARAGYALTVYNRTRDKADALVSQGAAWADSPRHVADASPIVITMLADADAVQHVLAGPQGLLEGGGPGSVLIDMSTVSPEESRAMAAQAAESGWAMLDAPVFGSTGPAREGTLGIMVGGDHPVYERQKELLGTMGSHLYFLGPQGAGASAKLAFNLLVGAQVASLAEAMALAAKSGIELSMMREIILASGVVSNLIQRKADNIVQGDFAPAFSLKHMSKDLGLMMDTAHDKQVSLPVTAAIHQLFVAAQASGYGDEDASAVYRLLAALAGMKS
jgi:3-hydroxyisobutyrate dehydrogenase-like beta-hydroxyacid dehydrogenase